MYRHYAHIDNVTNENKDKKLMEHLTDHCNENPMNHLDDSEYLEKIKIEVNNYVNPYIICDDMDFNCLI